MDCREKYGSTVCAVKSVDCANPYFEPNIVINPRRACAARVTVVVLCVCMYVCMCVCPLIPAASHIGIAKERYQRILRNTGIVLRRVHTAPKIEPYSNWFETGSGQCALIAFTLHFSRNLTSTLRLRMSRDCHARAVVLLVKNGSSTSSCCTAGVAVGFSTITRTHRALRVSRETRFRAMMRRRQRRRR